MTDDAFDNLSPDARISIQDYYVTRRFPRCNDYTGPERRANRKPPVKAWPRAWRIHSEPSGLRSNWTPSYISQCSPEWREKHGL